MATERLNVFKLGTDKVVYVTKLGEEKIVVIANTSELNKRIEQVSCTIFCFLLSHCIVHCVICNASLFRLPP